MKQRIRILLLASLCYLAPTWALAEVTVSIETEKRVVETVDGRDVERFIAADTAEPGDLLRFVVTIRNTASEPATGVTIDDPVPGTVSYVANSAWGDGSTVLLSADGGQSFAAESALEVAVTGRDGQVTRRPAEPGEVTHVRWQVGSLAPDAALTVGFAAEVK